MEDFVWTNLRVYEFDEDGDPIPLSEKDLGYDGIEGSAKYVGETMYEGHKLLVGLTEEGLMTTAGCDDKFGFGVHDEGYIDDLPDLTDEQKHAKFDQLMIDLARSFGKFVVAENPKVLIDYPEFVVPDSLTPRVAFGPVSGA